MFWSMWYRQGNSVGRFACEFCDVSIYRDDRTGMLPGPWPRYCEKHNQPLTEDDVLEAYRLLEDVDTYSSFLGLLNWKVA